MRTVYIRKENEEFFDNLANKAATINSILVKLKEKQSPEPKYTDIEPTA